jgi:hypothetical protein
LEILKNINLEGKEFLIEIRTFAEINQFNFDQTTKNINEFLRNSYREFAASSSIIDYEVVDGRICTGCGNHCEQQGECI